jgi:hypothetical protein
MSLNTALRAGAHLPKNLTLAETLIFKEIALRINGTKADLMRLGVRYLAKATNVSERKTGQAITSLIAKGYLSATQASKRTARVFVVTLDCPADCKKVKNHYSAAENKARFMARNSPAPMAETGRSEPSSVALSSSLSVALSSSECGTEFLTNTELNKEQRVPVSGTSASNRNTTNIDPVTSAETSVLVSLSEWIKVCSNTLAKVPEYKFTEHHRELENDPHAYHLSANDFLKGQLERGSIIGNYTAYLSRLIIANPHELMRTAAGNSKTLKRLAKYIGQQLTEYTDWKDESSDTRELLFDKELMTAGLLAAYSTEWLDTFSAAGTLNRTLFVEQVNALLAANPEAYKHLEKAITANPY